MYFNKRQNGATLFIGLMLLIAISIVSLAAMRTSVLDLVITNNKQQFVDTFESAEQVINAAIKNPSLAINGNEFRGDIIADSGTTPDDFITQTTKTNNAGQQVVVADIDTEIMYSNQGSADGWELNDSTAYYFQLDAEAESRGRNTRANHRVGFYIVAPNAN